MSRRQKIITVGGLLLLGGSFALLPMVVQKRHLGNNLTAKQTPLTGTQIMRGAYINSGSKDVGPDPDWDLERGVYLGPSGRRFSPSDEEIAEARRRLESKGVRPKETSS